MAKEEREPLYWITVNGAHVPIYEHTSKWMPMDMRERYSRYIDDHSFDYALDSDEKTWVEILRHERDEERRKLPQDIDKKEAQIKANQAEANRLNQRDKDDELKPWSKTEEKRSQEMSKWVNDKLRTGSFGEFYEETFVEDVATKKLPASKRFKEDTLTLSKMNITYVQNWDENDRRVKQGKPVTGSTYYVVQTDDGSIDESCFAYKTKTDALHAMELYYRDEMKRRS